MINLQHIADDQLVAFPITRGIFEDFDDSGWELVIFNTFGNYPIDVEWGTLQPGMPDPEDMVSYDHRYIWAVLKGLDKVPVGSYEYRIYAPDVEGDQTRACGCLTIGYL